MFARVLVLVLGIVGGLSTGLVGMKWLGASGHVATIKALPDADAQKVKDGVARLESMSTASYMLLLSAALGIGGAVCGGLGKKWLAVGLLLAAVPLPLFFSFWTIVPISALLAAGCFAFFIRAPEYPFEEGVGGCWNALKGWFNVGGIKVKLDGIDAKLSKNGSLFSGTVQLFAKSDKHVNAIHYKLVRKRSKGKDEEKEEDENVLGETGQELDLDLQKGETHTLEFSLPYKFSKGLKDMGGVLGGVGKLAAFVSSEKDEYFFIAEAEVAGSLFDATGQLQVNVVE